MVRKAVFALALLLAACGGGEAYDMFSYDEIAPDGLRVRYANDRPPRITTIDSFYQEVAACMGISPVPHGPLVVIEDNLIAKVGRDGVYFKPDLIRIDSQITTFEDPAIMPHYIFKHEMVHFLLYATTEDPDSDHHSTFFDSCGH